METLTRTASHPPSPRGQAGFSLVEVLVAMAITVTAALALAGMLAQGTALMLGSESQLIAKQKAAEAIESVFTARDTRVLTWALIRNEVGETGADGGVFRDGFQSLRVAGPDGLVNTADDGAVEALTKPGPDGVVGNGDDEVIPLADYQREIRIRTIGPNLRSVTVIIRFRVGTGTRDYTLVTYISSYA
jgi:prepilin-type N-terminal cleavage/methylation domain-containing protein